MRILGGEWLRANDWDLDEQATARKRRTTRVSLGHASHLATRPAPESPGRHGLARRYRVLIATLSIGAHLGILAALLSFRSDPPRMSEPEPLPMPIALVELPPPPPKPKAPEPPAPKAPDKPPPKLHVSKPAPPEVTPLPVKPAPKASISAMELSEAQIAGAATAGSGAGGGGECDVAHWLQSGLRKDARVQEALHRGALGPGSLSKAIMVWNGDWVRSPGEDGDGLAVIREAIMMEILSAPAACRAQPMRGLILISPMDASGSARIALGSGEWRWSELLVPRTGVAGHGIPPR